MTTELLTRVNTNTDLITAVNKQIANWTILYEKLHNYHWFIKGHHFFTLHGKFEEFYNEAAGYIDELAERILSIGGNPVGTLKECLEIASIKEAAGNENETEMVKVVQADFELMVNEIKGILGMAENSGDDGTGDMLLGIQSSLEKHIWMLQAFLG